MPIGGISEARHFKSEWPLLAVLAHRCDSIEDPLPEVVLTFRAGGANPAYPQQTGKSWLYTGHAESPEEIDEGANRQSAHLQGFP